MRIRILSDLHLEFYKDWSLPAIRDDVDCDVVVLAGDIHLGTKGIEWAARTFDRPVIYVLGNHEYYRQDAMKLRRDARIQAKATGIHLLERDEVRIDGQRFLGCTLWTDFSLGPEPRYFAARLAENQLSDFRMIRYRRGRITVDAMSEWYRESRKWLEARLDEPGPAVVVTHFVPSPQLIHPTFGRGDQLTPYFTTDLEYLMGDDLPLWIYGHNHYSDDRIIRTEHGETRAVSNQMGYPREGVKCAMDFCVEL